MQKFFQLFTLLIFTTVILSCSQKQSAIEFKGYTFYGKDYYEYNDGRGDKRNRRDLRASKQNKDAPKEAKKEAKNAEAKETKVVETKVVATAPTCSAVIKGSKKIEVEYGDTLYGLAIKHDVPVKKLIELNNLKDPYILKQGQKLVTSPTTQHKVKSGENLSRIAESYNVKSTEIASLNNLEKPYLIKVGQELKLPSGYECKQVAQTKKPSQGIKKVAKNEPKAPIKSAPLFKKNNFVWPVKGNVISKFGPKEGSLYNDGINISSAKSTPFKATEDGVVAYVGNELKGYGNLVIVKHANNWVSAYAHADTISVERGASVKKGDVIGKVGQTGNVDRPQLYFGLRKGRKALDPERYLK